MPSHTLENNQDNAALKHEHISEDSVLAIKSNYTRCEVKWCVIRVKEFCALKAMLRDPRFELSQWVCGSPKASILEQDTFHINCVIKRPRALGAIVLLMWQKLQP